MIASRLAEFAVCTGQAAGAYAYRRLFAACPEVVALLGWWVVQLRTIALLFFGLTGSWIVATGCRQAGEADFQAGRRELAAGNLVLARTLLDRSIRARPGHPANAEAYNLLGVACAQIGDVVAAAQAFEESRRLRPNWAAPVYNLGCLYRDAGQLDRAIELFIEAANLAPEDPRPLEMIARIHAGRQQWNEAAARWQEALQRSPASPRVLTSLAEVELRRVGIPAALSFLNKAIEIDHGYAPALYNLYVLHAFGLNDPEAAEPYARQFLERVPADTARAVGVRAWVEARKGAVSSRDSRTMPATGAVARTRGSAAAVATNPPVTSPTPEPAPSPGRLLELAEQAIQEGRRTEALGRCLDALAKARGAGDTNLEDRIVASLVKWFPNDARAYVVHGEWLERRQQPEAARRAYLAAIERAPNLPDAHRGLARVALQGGDDELDTGLTSLRRVLQLAPDDAEARWMLAQLYDQTLHRTNDAVREYGEFAKRFPQDPRTVVARERMQALQLPLSSPSAGTVGGLTPTATATVSGPPPLPPHTGRQIPVRESERYDTAGATAAFNRAAEWARKGDVRRATQEYLRALELDSSYFLAYYNLGELYLRQSDLDLARDAYRRAVSLSPEHAGARYNLAYVLDLLGESQAAREQLLYLVSQHPSHAAAWYLLGTIASREPATKDLAVRAFSRFLELAPNDPRCPHVRSWLEHARRS